MMDVVERLLDKWKHSEELCYEAADRIKELEAALRFYSDPYRYTDANGDDVQVPDFYSEYDFGMTAKRALEGRK